MNDKLYSETTCQIDDVKSLNLPTFKELERLLIYHAVEWEDLAESITLVDNIYRTKLGSYVDDDVEDEILFHYDCFRNEFQCEFGVGILLSHFSDLTDDDDLEDVFFILKKEDIYELTAKAALLNEQLPFKTMNWAD
ncbi:MAG: hypothetical protein KIG84_09010 [Bacteroidales bacterium]|nr:hypothetical protein [Bacteroidales bacterium]